MRIEIKDGKYILTGVFTEFNTFTRNRPYYDYPYRNINRKDSIDKIFNSL
jgi:hypothetical protein